MNENSKQLRSGKIPAFGNWDEVKELPITQYFENARQAGLKTSGTCHSRDQTKFYHPPHLDYKKKRNTTFKSYSHFEEHEKKGGKVSCTCTHRHSQVQNQNITGGVVSASHPKLLPNIKPVDEDLYKIPSEILHNSKRKKLFRFFSRCFVPRTI